MKDKTTALKYANLISKSQKELEQEELALKVQEAKSNLEITIATTKRDLAQANKRLIASQSAVPYDVSAELIIFEEVRNLTEGLAFAEEILATRF